MDQKATLYSSCQFARNRPRSRSCRSPNSWSNAVTTSHSSRPTKATSSGTPRTFATSLLCQDISTKWWTSFRPTCGTNQTRQCSKKLKRHSHIGTKKQSKWMRYVIHFKVLPTNVFLKISLKGKMILFYLNNTHFDKEAKSKSVSILCLGFLHPGN